MRRVAAVQTVLALLLAFVLAPFQHVHTDSDHPGHASAGEIHAHFFTVHAHAPKNPVNGAVFDDDDDDDHAHVRSIDSVVPVLPHGVPSFIPAPSPVLPVAGTQAQDPIATVEATANSPPLPDQSTPRAPPL